LAAFVAVRVVIAVLVRPHFMSPVSKLVSLAQGSNSLPAGYWLLSNPANVGPNHILLTYQPADRFWAFQGIEAAVFIVLAAVLIALTCRVVVARDA
jgi:hypothetical protein